jgi:uncharacterized protein (DUF433 family)
MYGGMNPREVPSYATWEAARYLRIPLRTVQHWTAGFHHVDHSGRRRFAKPLVKIADPAHHLLSFVNIAELHVLDSLRYFHQVPSIKLRRLIEYLEETFKSDHPLVNEAMFAGGGKVFIERAEQLIEATQHGQIAFREVAEAHLERIDQDVDGLAIRLFPFIRKPDPQMGREAMNEPRIIQIDPRIRYGRPVIAGTGIPTLEIAERFRAGDSFDALAEEYGRSPTEIQEAIRCELTLDTPSSSAA